MFDVEKYFESVKGKTVNTGGDTQCVALFNNYLNNLINNEVFIGCNWAFDLFENRTKNGILHYFYEVDVKDIKQGDVCFWKWDGKVQSPEFHNHVNIFDCWSDSQHNSAYFIEQNFPNDGKHRFVSRNHHTVRVLVGALRPKLFMPVGAKVLYKKAYDRPFHTKETASRVLGEGTVIAITNYQDKFSSGGFDYESANYIVQTTGTIVFVMRDDITKVKEG